MPNNITPLKYEWKDPDDKVYVVAGTRAEFDSYRTKKMNEGSRSQYYFVATPEALLGLSRIKGVFVGSWKQRSDIDRIQDAIHIIKERMKYDTQVSTSAGFMAQEIDQELLTTLKQSPSTTITASPSNFGAITEASIASSNLTEAYIRDMMKKYIDEALANPKTLGGI
jgi:hypothetical protein